MNPRPAPVTNLRKLARLAGVSHTTVSRCLRDDPAHSPALRARIRRLAEEHGYLPNPYVNILMSTIRQGRIPRSGGVIAWLSSSSQERMWATPYWARQMEGARERAARAGYSVEMFRIGQGGLSQTRLAGILTARGIRGVIIGYVAPHFVLLLPFTPFSLAVSGYRLAEPGLHRVAMDQFQAVGLAVETARARGFSRPALLLTPESDEAAVHRWTGGFLAATRSCRPRAPIFRGHPGADMERFLRRHRPDVCFSTNSEIFTHCAKQGFLDRPDRGFAGLGIDSTWPVSKGRRIAGVRLDSAAIGSALIDLVLAQVGRNERGVPEIQKTLSLPASWIEGTTLPRNRATPA
jgi:LacI family transcriptional regulator